MLKHNYVLYSSLAGWLAGSPGITVVSGFRSECWMRERERGMVNMN